MTFFRLHKRILQAGCVFLGAVLLLFSFLPPVHAAGTLSGLITGAFQARTAYSAESGRLLSDPVFLERSAGTGTGDWAAFAMARYSAVDGDGRILYAYDEDYAACRDALKAALDAFYQSAGVTAGIKLTEYYRMGIALTALGGDCTDIILASTVNNPVALKRLSIITLDYALIALDLKATPVPANAAHTRRDLIDRILELQTDDGGWSLTAMAGGGADADVTAMTLTALAPYYRAGDAAVVSAAEQALSMLSSRQRAQGDFASYGIFNCESTAQVLTALTSMGIDPLTDARFIKNGVTVPDGLLRYRLPDGSFTHSFTSDPDNPAASAGNYNYLATDQASYALVSLWRQQQGLNPLFDMRPDTRDTLSSLWQRALESIRAMFARLTEWIRAMGTKR